MNVQRIWLIHIRPVIPKQMHFASAESKDGGGWG
jgi:hypothetical protein